MSDLLLKEETDILFEGIEVSDEQKEKFAVTLEAVLTEKAREIKTALDEKTEEELQSAKEEQMKELEEAVDKYLEYVVEQYMEENKLAIENGVKLEMFESFMNGMKDLFEQNNVTVPEGKEDILAVAEEKAESAQADLNAKINENIELKNQIKAMQKEKIISENTAGMADTQKEKLESLVEDVEFTNAEAFGAKVKTIRESFFKVETDVKPETEVKTELKESKVDDATKARMQRYLDAL